MANDKSPPVDPRQGSADRETNQVSTLTYWVGLLALVVAPWCMLIYPMLSTFRHIHAGWVLGPLIFIILTVLVGMYEWCFLTFARFVVWPGACRKAKDKTYYETEYSKIEPPPNDQGLTKALDALRSASESESDHARAAAEQAMKAALREYVKRDGGAPTLSGCLALMVQAGESFSKAKERRLDRISYIRDHLQSRINDEYSDISSRTGWLMTGQAFLLGAFVATLALTGLDEETKHWLSTGVAFSGAVISFVLSLSTFFGHALIEKLKMPRGVAETIMEREFHIPPAGVPVKDPTHRLGHAATRYLPTYAYAGWVGLTLLALTNHFAGSGSDFNVIAYEALTRPEFMRGWVAYEQPTPPFPVAATTYAEPDKRCPDNAEAAEQWVNKFVAAWATRSSPSPNDGLVVVGSADRVILGDLLKRKLDSNISLARGRAEEIKRRLVAKSDEQIAQNQLKPQHRISSEHVMVLVTGPRNTGSAAKAPTSTPPCTDPDLAADRTVEVWIPSRE